MTTVPHAAGPSTNGGLSGVDVAVLAGGLGTRAEWEGALEATELTRI